MNKKFNLLKFVVYTLLFVLIYEFVLMIVYDFDYVLLFQTPTKTIKISIIYAIIASILDALDIAFRSENRTKALRTGYTTHKLYIVKNGRKKCNYHYLLSAFSWGTGIAFLLFAFLSKEYNNILLLIISTLIIGLASGLFTAGIWGRSIISISKKKNKE